MTISSRRKSVNCTFSEGLSTSMEAPMKSKFRYDHHVYWVVGLKKDLFEWNFGEMITDTITHIKKYISSIVSSMGVYLPTDGRNTSNDATDRSETSRFTRWSNRPTIGLKVWGPVVPAADCLPCLYFLTALQATTAMTMWVTGRRLRFQHGGFKKVVKWSSYIGGAYLMFNTGLEIARFCLPYEPWYNEAKMERKIAVERGEKVSMWYGPVNYTPMNMTMWMQKLENYGKVLDSQNGPMITNGPIASNKYLSELVRNSQLSLIYEESKNFNRERFNTLLNNELSSVNEFNKIDRFDIALNSHFKKSHIQIGNHKLDSDDDLEFVWSSFEPWVELSNDTDYNVRFIPRWRWMFAEKSQVEEVGENVQSAEFQPLEYERK